MGKAILKLRAEGLSYRAICKQLNCSLSTVSYHCGIGQKEKNLARHRLRQENNVIFKKLENFRYRKTSNKTKKPRKNNRNIIKEKCRDFQRRVIKPGRSKFMSKPNCLFTYEELLTKIENDPICYLTGEPINLNETDTYHFDHITPATKGGTNELSNLGLACKMANLAKSDMTVEELLILCQKILVHNGYKVEKSAT